MAKGEVSVKMSVDLLPVPPQVWIYKDDTDQQVKEKLHFAWFSGSPVTLHSRRDSRKYWSRFPGPPGMRHESIEDFMHEISIGFLLIEGFDNARLTVDLRPDLSPGNWKSVAAVAVAFGTLPIVVVEGMFPLPGTTPEVHHRRFRQFIDRRLGEEFVLHKSGSVGSSELPRPELEEARAKMQLALPAPPVRGGRGGDSIEALLLKHPQTVDVGPFARDVAAMRMEAVK